MNTLVKYSFFTVIYIGLTWFLSDELGCAIAGNQTCVLNFMVKYVVFMVLMIIYNKWIKGKIFKKN